MARSKSIGLVMAAVFALFLLSAASAGAANVPDVFEMKSPYEHTKSIVSFTHEKHSTDYKIGCGDCHHDDQGKPLTNLKKGDPVQKCIACHKKPGEIKGKEAKGLTDKEKRAYHANAVHDNCIDCHKKFNKGKDPKPAPQTCKGCHLKDAE